MKEPNPIWILRHEPAAGAHVIEAVERLARARVLVVGDLMLDRYLWGEVERISPEAPVPVVRHQREESRLGGAANVIANLVALGCTVGACGLVGEDAGGSALLALLQGLGVNREAVLADAARPTTEKLRIMAGHQQLLRVDHEQALPLSPALLARMQAALERLLPSFDGVIVSDYGKGVVTPELVAWLVERVGSSGDGSPSRAGSPSPTGNGRRLPIVVDPKGQDYRKYRGVTCITPNEHEAALATRLSIGNDAEALAAAQALAGQVRSPYVCITRGAKGVLALDQGGAHRLLPALAREVYDVTGAGDTFIGVFGALLIGGCPFFEAVEVANVAASVAVGKLGTATVSPQEILAQSALRQQVFPPGAQGREAIGTVADALHAQGRKVVFTNGCFDLLHAGHIQYLQESRAQGDALIVGLNSDASVRRLKGPNRPVIGEEDRAHLLAALASVDFVAIFEEDDPLELIRRIRPDVLTKGQDYTVDTVVGHELVQQWGGQVRLIPLKENRSTSGLINKIVAAHGR